MSRVAAVACLLAAIQVGCGGAAAVTGPRAERPDAPRVSWRGRVLYEARAPTDAGSSETLERRPARRVRVEALGRDGVVLGTSSTAEDGTFTVRAPAAAERLVVRARVDAPFDLAVTRDAQGRQDHRLEVPLGPPGQPLEVIASDTGSEAVGGAFHILDTELRGLEAVERWTGRRLPALFTYWARGVTTTWSYYRGERPAGSGRYCLELLGGEPGRQHTSDTDEHDEAIILHELGHFVMDRLSTDSSAGGDHPAGVLLDPGLAWEEGRATWFAVAVLGAPRYLDTVGIAPSGHLRVDHDLERGTGGPRGAGSEQGVAEILWDLADGAGGLPDADRDGVALGPAAVLEAMIGLREVPGAYPAVGSFLGGLVDDGTVDAGAMARLLAHGRHPVEMLPGEQGPGWPLDVSVPGQASGKIDGHTNPAPSGGPNRPDTGVDAVRVYRVHVADASWLGARLRIFGSGRADDRQDLDLELRDIRANLLASARGEEPVERLLSRVEPGWYVIYVRDGGSGNKVGYRLDVWTE